MKIDIHMMQEEYAPQKKFALLSRSPIISVQSVLIGIMIVSTLLRVGSAIYQGNTIAPLPGIYDQISYDGLAQRVIGGYGFSFGEDHWPATRAGEPTAHWSYLYTLYLAVVYALFGLSPVIARLIQATIAGVLHSWLVYRIGCRVFGSTIGIVAAGINAIYIYFFYYGGALITETFYIIGILWTFDIALCLAAKSKELDETAPTQAWQWQLWFELGIAIGITVLLRQLFLLFIPFLFTWLWWNIAKRKVTLAILIQLPRILDGSVLKGFLITTGLMIILVAPWTLRNYRVFHTFVPLNTNAGYAFFWGNHPIYGTQFIGILPDDGPSYYDLIPKELLHLNEAELDRALLTAGINFVIADPIRYLLLSLSRANEYFKFWPSAGSGMISNIARVGSFGLWLPFMLYGLWLSMAFVRHSKQRAQGAAIVLLYLFIIVYSGIHLLSWALIRYRLPIDAVLILFAALGVVNLTQYVRRVVYRIS